MLELSDTKRSLLETNSSSEDSDSSIHKGFRSFLKEQPLGNEMFKSEILEMMEKVEKNHFWFAIRNAIIPWFLRKHLPNLNSFLEVGCGTGYILSSVKKQFSNIKLFGIDIFVESLQLSQKKIPLATFLQADARNFSLKNCVECVGAFDVLEHIQEDTIVLKNIWNALIPGGHFLVAVPQHPWLWSHTDDYLLHVRRYTNKELSKKLQDAGFKIVRSTSFISFLFPFMILSRISAKLKREENFDPHQELNIHQWLNQLFLKILKVEFSLIKKGWNFPFGGSRLILAKKIST